MNHTRVFVSYVPDAHLARRLAGQRQLSARAPKMAVLAGALLAGGSAHSLAVGDGFEPARLDSPVKLPPVAIATPTGFSAQDALPFLGLALVDAQPSAPPAASRPARAPEASAELAPPEPMLPKPASAPRRDLAGFLAEQGHLLVPADAESPAAAEPQGLEANSVETQAPAPAAALAMPVAASAQSAETITQSVIDQTFPTLSVNGAALGAVTMRGDTVHLAGLLGLLELRMPAEEFARLKAAPAADSFVSLATLREAGLEVTIDPAGERLALAAL